MLRDNLVELIEPMRNSAGAGLLALGIYQQKPASDDSLSCLENPRPEGAESSLTDNVTSPFPAEPRQYGQDRRGDELPEELQRRETRMARIREAKRALEERAREQAKSKGKDPEEAQPTKKAQYNFTDPESRMLKGSDGFLQGYNTQIAVEPVFQLIVGQRVTQAANDKQQMVPLVEAIEEQSGQKPEEVLADNGYCSDENLQYLARKRMEGFVATGKQKHRQRREPCKPGPLPREASRIERMERKLETKVGAAVYATRKWIVEPVFGQIKQARGFRQFLLRGIEKVRGEWALICMTHNLLKFHKICSG